jgi:MFS family permease
MTTPESPTTAHTDAYAAFRAPGLLPYLLGTTLLQIGLAAQGVALGWDIFQRTGQPLSLGLVGGVQAIPMILLSLPAGFLADRVDRRAIVITCMVGLAACSLGLAWVSFHQGALWLMYLLLLLDATFATLARPASASIYPTLTTPETFENAMKWHSSGFQLSSVIGPAIGAAIIVWSVPAAYVFSAMMALAFVAVLLALRLRRSPASAGAATLANVLAGVRFVWSRNVLLAAISLDLFAVLLGGAVYLLPVYAKEILFFGDQPVGEVGLGFLRAAPAVGALAMAFMLAHLPPFKRAGRTMLLAVAGFGVATVIFGLSRNFYLSLAMLFLTGALDNISVVVRHTLIQGLTPDSMRGRVSAVNHIFIGSSNEIGGLESGLVAQWLGTVVSVVVGGIGTVLVVLAWARGFPRLRHFGALTGIVPDVDEAEEPRPA